MKLTNHADLLSKAFKSLEQLPELKCNHCGLVFKGEHECDYEKLKEINRGLKSLCLWSARRLSHEQYKDFAYDDYEKITGEKTERL